jgi:periplasmic protein TonB
VNARGISGAIALTLHVVVLAALLSYAPARSAMLAAAPIMVSLITAQRAEPKPEPPVEIPPPKPKPVVRPKPPEPVMIAAPTPAPAVMAAPPLPPEPPAPAPEVQAPVPAPVAAVPLEPLISPITPPIFTADYLDNPSPLYPLASRRSGQQGRVVLRVLVNTNGTADLVQVHASSGHVRLDESARDTVLQRWRFVPAKRGAQPVPAWVLIPISFGLDS